MSESKFKLGQSVSTPNGVGFIEDILLPDSPTYFPVTHIGETFYFVRIKTHTVSWYPESFLSLTLFPLSKIFSE